MRLCESFLMFQNRIIVSESLQVETLQKIHHGHQGIERFCLRLTTAVSWSGASKNMEILSADVPSACIIAHL